ncbi:hypothetical protein, partial [Metasolibacillus meyeri]|uniref:hypothetical protein n=1 Tax=Metasolibacillus meyeri TaxID=1071052 RepID=UPI001930E66E
MNIYTNLPKKYKSFYYHPDYVLASVNRGAAVFFAEKEGDKIFYHPCILNAVLDTEYRDIESVYGYGGPIILGDEFFKKKVIANYLEWCKTNKILVEFIRFHPMLENDQFYYGEKYYNRKTIYIDLKQESISKGYNTRTKRNIKKAIKNKIKIVNSKNLQYIESFKQIYVNLMKA